MSKPEALQSDFARAVDRLDEACRRVEVSQEPDALLRDGLIQRFEFCFELGWKAIQAAAAAEGVSVRSLKSALTHALASGWIEGEAAWLRMLEARNLSSHTYNERIASDLALEIPRFLNPLRQLVESLARGPAT